jgi:alpha-galactosidase/6-phospho-beta-glucosidase family protein
MAKVKIAIIGGGSFAWTPTIVRDIVITQALDGSTICLEDINPQALKLTARAARRCIRQAKAHFKVVTTESQKEALRGADYVILTISTGGLEAMRQDLEIPYKYGIYQPVGDTVGPGGLSRALRNIPVVVGIARDMERFCPDAWLLNYTNPMTTLSRAVTKVTRVKTIGLCHELYGTTRTIRRWLNLPRQVLIEARVGGINHLPWILDLSIDGKDGMAMLRDYVKKHGTGASAVKLELFRVYGALPAAGDRHVCEWFPYFLTKESNWGATFGVQLTTIEERYGWFDSAQKHVRKLASGEEQFDLTPSQEAASRLIAGLATGTYTVDVMNLPNRGQLPDLPPDAVVETMGAVGPTGAQGFAGGPMPRGVVGHLAKLVAMQEMVVDAALTGDRKLALEALLLDPLVTEYSTAEKMLDELIRATKKYLPQF